MVDDNNTGVPKVVDARRESISRGVHNDLVFASFKAHKFSYLNITALGTDYVLNDNECGFACVEIPSCFSFNMAAYHDINGRTLCELLPSDKYNNSDKLVTSQSFHHFSNAVSTDYLQKGDDTSTVIKDPFFYPVCAILSLLRVR